MMGTGDGRGRRTARSRRRSRAISSPLLEGASVNGARGVIINVTGGPDLSLVEVSEALDDHPGGGARGRQHHLRRGRRSGADGQGEDHGDRHRLRARRRDRATRLERRADAGRHDAATPTQPRLRAEPAAAGRRRAARSPRLSIARRPSIELPLGVGGRPAAPASGAGRLEARRAARPSAGRARHSTSTCRRSCGGTRAERDGASGAPACAVVE